MIKLLIGREFLQVLLIRVVVLFEVLVVRVVVSVASLCLPLLSLLSHFTFAVCPRALFLFLYPYLFEG